MTTIDFRDQAEFTIDGMLAAARESGADSCKMPLTPEQREYLHSQLKWVGRTVRYPDGCRTREIRIS